MNKNFHIKCNDLLLAYKEGKLGQTKMPEDSSPKFSKSDNEIRLILFYFTYGSKLSER